MTLTEKILCRKSGRAEVRPGENVWVNVDVLMTHDVCGPGTIGVFRREFGKEARVWDPNRVVLIPDHYIFTTDSLANRNVDILREFAKEQGIRYFYDVIDDSEGRWRYKAEKGPFKRQYGSRYAGVCHSALPEHGHTRPGEVLLGTDSHTCTAGAFNEFATGIGNTDAGFVLGTGRILLRIPPTLRFLLDGELPSGVMAKDVILHIIGMIGFDGATYKAMEYGGEGVGGLTMDDRMTIANMAIEAGGKNGIFPCDEATVAFVRERTEAEGTVSEFEPVEQDLGAPVEAEYRIDLSELEPLVALHPNPGNRRKAREVTDIKIDRAYIGSCTGGKTSDFLAFARIVKGKEVKVPTFGVPATPRVVEELQRAQLGEKTVWEILEESGVRMTENASCAACLGGPEDSFGRLNSPMTCISATNRNFPGRMGHRDSRVILASPATVAASALAGHIADPRD
ncbi:MAG: homoaconitate hydratase family protein [Candidatus Hydrogenedentota bacterium]|nr:MAG: homoaconitate hydratase family protein [Candidatus Hydrogenedentota bacterium]